ncbi:hypothetical protein STTU_5641 [Streptomyces sp. Tu6071]|nr:hypothetical protein STTU_5641 [Streptomyces sp. Tu6071]
MVAQELEAADAVVQLGAPVLRETGPVLRGRGALLGQVGERLADRGEGDADALRGTDEGDPAEDVARVAALVAGGATARDEPLGLVEVERGDGGPAARGELSDGEFLHGFRDLRHPAQRTGAGTAAAVDSGPPHP